MSALVMSHIPDAKKTTLTLTVEMLRKNDVIIDGVEIDKLVTVNRIFAADDIRMLTLIDSRNNVYYREYDVDVEVVIRN